MADRNRSAGKLLRYCPGSADGQPRHLDAAAAERLAADNLSVTRLREANPGGIYGEPHFGACPPGCPGQRR